MNLCSGGPTMTVIKAAPIPDDDTIGCAFFSEMPGTPAIRETFPARALTVVAKRSDDDPEIPGD